MKRGWEGRVIKAFEGRDNGGKPHQRACTLVDPAPEAGRFALPDPRPRHLAEAGSARAIGKHIRKGLAVDKDRLSTPGYWHAA